MWTFKTTGQGEQASGFNATVDGPVSDARREMALLYGHSHPLQPAPRELLKQAMQLVEHLVGEPVNGQRRLSVNIDGGEGARTAWTLRLHIDLSEDPQAP